mmetsp:Transcript_30933/g.51481  ORF Transcript_30933/g.51481 Transcript_30933/m.51481 type:complete len:91 (-) Transcript_30933:354-626(-)
MKFLPDVYPPIKTPPQNTKKATDQFIILMYFRSIGGFYHNICILVRKCKIVCDCWDNVCSKRGGECSKKRVDCSKEWKGNCKEKHYGTQW